MTIINKLSDRDNFIYEAITMILVNMGEMEFKQLQWELFSRGVYIKKPLLVEAMKFMKEKGMLTQKPKMEVSKAPKIITTL